MWSRGYSNIDDPFEEDLDFEDEEGPGVVFRDREELGQMGHDLYCEMMESTSNQQDKDTIRQAHASSNEKFTDQQFPANASSLIEDWSTADYHTQRTWKNFKWMRVDDFLKQPIKVFNSIDPNDILQGSLGDCYFLSTLSAIAEFPTRIMRCFDNQEYQSSGCYSINMCEMGKMVDIVVDDFFPCNPDGTIAFSGPHIEQGVSELWVLLLEKAWAKRFGSYMSIDAGFTEDCLRDLTGGPCVIVDCEDPDMWGKIFDGNEKNFIITAASAGDDGCGDLVNEMGLVTLHAYAVIDAREVSTRAGTECIVKIRNPWGSQEWTGDWSDDSSKWTPALKAELGWEATDDGTFWMSFEDFSYYFTGVTICHVHDGYSFEGINTRQNEGAFSVFKVSVPEGGDTYFSVTQQDSRRFGEDSGYDYSPVRIVVAEKNGKDLRFINGKANAYMRDVWMRCELQPGEHLVYVQIDWLDNFTDELGFSAYSASSLTVSDVTFQEKDFMQRVYSVELAQEEAEPREIAPGITFTTGQHFGPDEEGTFMEGFVFDAIANDSRDTLLDIEIIHKNFENIELLEPYSGDSYKLSLQPGESAIVVKRQISLLEETELTIAMKKSTTRV